MNQHRDADEVDFAIVGTGAGGGTLAARLGREGLLGRGLRRRPVLPPARRVRVRRDRAGEALLERPAHRRGHRSAGHGRQELVARRWAARPCISPWCRCASGRNGSRRARRSATAPTGRSIGARCGTTTGEAERALSQSPGRSTIPGDPSPPALPLPPHPMNAAGRGAGARVRGDGHEVDADAARHRLRAAHGKSPSVRLSRLLPFRLLHQRQAERAGRVDPARDRGRGRDPRPRHGGTDRDRTCARARDRASTIVRDGAVAVPEGPQRHRGSGYAVETPRLLLDVGDRQVSAMGSPIRRASSGKNLMTQSEPGRLRATSKDEIRWSEGTPLARPSPSTGTTTTARIFTAVIAGWVKAHCRSSGRRW